MSPKNKLKADLILEVAELQQRIKELESVDSGQLRKEIETNWHEFAKSLPDHILTLSPSLNIEYVNHPSPGLTRDDLIGNPITMFLDENIQEETRNILLSVLNTEEAAIYETEYQIPGSDGGKRYYETHAIPRISDNVVVGLTLNSRDITHRKEEDKKLFESEKNLREAQKIGGLGFWGLDIATGKLDWSDETFIIYGFEPQEFEPTFEKFKEIVHPDDIERVQQNVDSAISGHTRYDLDFRIIQPGKEVRWLHCEGEISRDESGQAILFFGTQIDITEHKNSEDKIRKQEERIRSIFKSAPIGIGVVINRVINQVNDHMCEMTGYTAEELINQKSRMLYPTQEDFEKVGKDKYKQIERFGSGIVESKLKRKNGDIINVLISSTPIDEQDLLKGVTFTVMDITERNKAQEEQISAARAWHNTFDAVSDAICLLDTDQQIVQTNLAMKEMFPEHAGKMVGKKCFEVVHATQAPVEDCPVLRLRRSLQRETMVLPVDDRVFNVTADPITDDSGTLTGVVHSLSDITERVQVEQTLIKATNIINSSPAMAISWKNQEGWPVEYVSENVKNLLGYSVQELIEGPLDYINLIHTDDKTRVMGEVDIVGKKKNLLTIEHEPYRIITKNGDIKWIRDKTFVRRDAGGEITQYEGIIFDISEQIRSGKALTNSEKKYRELVNLAQEGIWVIDQESITTFVNPSMARMLGYTPDEMMGQHLYSFMDERGEDIATRNLERRQQGISEQHDFELIRKDNTRLIVTMEAAAIVDDDGNYAGAIAGVIDITKRVKAENALLESQRMLTTLMGNLPGMAYRCLNDQNYTMKFISNGCQELIGYSPDELVDNAKITYAEIIHPEDLDLIWKTIQDALVDKRNFQLTYRIETSHGDIKWVWEQGQGVFGKKNEVIAIEGFITDITELKLVEQALSHSHDLMQYIIEHNRSAIAVHDKDLNYIYVSKRYLEEYKVIDPDVIGKHYYEVFPDLPQKWRDVHQKALAGEVLSAEDDPYIREDGSTEWTRWECRPWHEADGTIGGIVVYTEVITERILEEQEKDQLLQQLHEANDRLKSLSRELINSQEAERKRISQELHDELGQALTAISLDLGIIEREISPDCTSEIKERIADTRILADELDQMIGELAFDLRPSLLDDLGLLPTINWYVETFSQRAEIEVEIQISGRENRLPSEIETALYRITQEALTNVAKHANATRVILKLDQQPKSMTIKIVDDGVGFDLNELHAAQIPLQGLGLIGMGDRTALLGGTLEIKSNPGEGTRIKIEIPLYGEYDGENQDFVG